MIFLASLHCGCQLMGNDQPPEGCAKHGVGSPTKELGRMILGRIIRILRRGKNYSTENPSIINRSVVVI